MLVQRLLKTPEGKPTLSNKAEVGCCCSVEKCQVLKYEFGFLLYAENPPTPPLWVIPETSSTSQ